MLKLLGIKARYTFWYYWELIWEYCQQAKISQVLISGEDLFDHIDDFIDDAFIEDINTEKIAQGDNFLLIIHYID